MPWASACWGEYVARIYDQVRARPLYLVDRAVNVATDRGSLGGLSTAEKDLAYEQLLRDAEELIDLVDEHNLDDEHNLVDEHNVLQHDAGDEQEFATEPAAKDHVEG